MYPVIKIKKEDKEYPLLLKEIYEPPDIIFARGNTELLNKKNLIAIVGTRKCSLYGKSTTKSIIQDLALYDIVIVSGLALGIDAIAHKNAIDNNLPTIAVLGGSVEESSIYPSQNKGLAKSILDNNGLIISEYPKGTITFPSNFLVRNRIIAGISKGTLVVEAPIKSGALSTARHARDENRSLYSVPGNIDSYISRGTNQLIKQGALCVTSAKDIVEDLQIFEKSKFNEIDLSTEEQEILNIITKHKSPIHVNKISEKTKIENQEIMKILINLTLSDYIQEKEQNYYIIKSV